jgi:predicted enzyme related to lactoylglutathione lyase
MARPRDADGPRSALGAGIRDRAKRESHSDQGQQAAVQSLLLRHLATGYFGRGPLMLTGHVSLLSNLIMARINFVELPAANLPAAKAFYGSVFGWDLTDFGPSYSCTMTGDVDLGLQGDGTEATRTPLAVIAVDDLEAAQASIERAGGVITRAIFAFPGGRRFHFTDPNGNELAALKVD